MHNANQMANPSGYGEGHQFLGSSTVTTDSLGISFFTVTFAVAAPPGRFISATVTDPGNNTSPFSNCVAMAGPIPPPSAPRRHEPGVDETIVWGPIASINIPALSDEKSVSTPIILERSHQPLERSAIDVLCGKRRQAETRFAELPRQDSMSGSFQAVLRTVSVVNSMARVERAIDHAGG